jgi:membrane glycosyltransferase
MRRETLKFELTGCGLMLIAFIIALSVGFLVLLAEGPVSVATVVMVVSFVAFCWVADRFGD